MSRDVSEIKIAKDIHGNITKASGAVYDDADIRLKKFLIECKRRDKTDYIKFSFKTWEKLRKQSVKANKVPLYLFQSDNEVFLFTYLDFYRSIDLKDFKIKSIDVGCTSDKGFSIRKSVFFSYYVNVRKKRNNIPILKFRWRNVEYAVAYFFDIKNFL